jgi:hypothetical protein
MVKRLALIFAFAFASVIAALPAVQQPAGALSLPTPAPTIAPNPPTHLPTYAVVAFGLNSCYHVGAAAGFNNSCAGSSQPTPGPAGPVADWQTLSKYFDYVQTGFQGIGIINGAGIKTVQYMDTGMPHDGLAFSSGVNGSISGRTNTISCPNAYPPSINLTSNYYGLPLYLPTNNPISCGGNYYGSVVGSVDGPAVDAWAQYIQNSISEYQINLLPGYGTSTEGIGSNNGVYEAFMDDMDYPARRLSYQLICLGTPASLGTSSAGATPTSCSDARLNMNPALPDSHPYLQLGKYPEAMNKQWVSGVRNLFRMPQHFGMKTAFNNYTDPTMYQYFNTPDRSNVEDATCEFCLGRNFYNGNGFFSQRDWMNQVNAEIVASEWGVKFHAYDMEETSVSDTVYNFASVWMGMRAPTDVIVTENFDTPLVNPNSKIGFSPLVWIVPTQPLNRSNNFYFDPIKVGYDPTVAAIPTTYGVGTMKQSGGAFLQEFAQCYRGDSGAPVSIGPCGAVINASPATVTMPATTQAYAHTATFTGNGIIKETQFGGGDTGVLNVAGGAPPTAGANIAANTAYLLTQ